MIDKRGWLFHPLLSIQTPNQRIIKTQPKKTGCFSGSLFAMKRFNLRSFQCLGKSKPGFYHRIHRLHD